MKKTLIYIVTLILALLVIVFFVVRNRKNSVVVTPQSEPIAMCYHYSKEAQRGYFDRAILKLNILGNAVTGEYQNLPAEKDSKVGKFSGSVGPMDPKIGGRIADVWWDSIAEGMKVTEQLKIEFGEGSASAFFGEMVDRGDGTYIYKDVTNLTPGFQMNQVDCASL